MDIEAFEIIAPIVDIETIAAWYGAAKNEDQEVLDCLMKKRSSSSPEFVVCLRNDGHPESLEVRKLYRVVADRQADKVDHVRVIDESGEDYLYPKSFFAPVRVSEPIKRALAAVKPAA